LTKSKQSTIINDFINIKFLLNMETVTNEDSRKKSKKKKNIISVIILIGGTVLAFLFFGPKGEEVVEEVEIVTPAQVEVMVLGEEGSQTAKLEKTATLKSVESAEAIAENTGRIKSVNFEVGNFAREGSVLAVFDQSKLENSAKVSLESARESLRLAERAVEKTKDFLRSELARGEESAKLQLNIIRIQREQARIQLEQAEIAYGRTFIKAPISGTIVAKNVHTDDFISQGQVIAQIVGGGKLETTLSLNNSQIKRIQTGDEVDIMVSGKIFKGEITYLSQVANSSNERFDVKIQTKEELKQEANKSAQIILSLRLDEEKTGAFFIPLEAVRIGQRKTEVFIAKNGKAMSIEVEIGEVIGVEVEITEGLRIGDNVIVENGRNLQDGQEVKIGQ